MRCFHILAAKLKWKSNRFVLVVRFMVVSVFLLMCSFSGSYFVRSLFGTVFEIRCGRFSCDVVFAVVSFDRAYLFKLISQV